MAKKLSSTEGTTEVGIEIIPGADSIASADTIGAQPAPEPERAGVPALQPEAVRSDSAPLKPGMQRVTLAQARAHHAAKHLDQV